MIERQVKRVLNKSRHSRILVQELNITGILELRSGKIPR